VCVSRWAVDSRGRGRKGVGELRNATDDVARRRRIKCFVIVAGWVVQRSVLQFLLCTHRQATNWSNKLKFQINNEKNDGSQKVYDFNT